MEANIRILKALYGDAFVLHCHKGDEYGTIVVDGGPNKDSRKVIEEFDKFGVIDLMVLTHYDLDHIGGILAYISKHRNDKPFPVKEIWCNCAYDVPVVSSPDISYSHAKKLADLLTEINESLKDGDFSEVIWQEQLMAGQKKERPFADFLILSPEQNVKILNDEQYSKSIANVSINRKRQKDSLQESLQELATRPKEQPSSSKTPELVNRSSIAFYLNCDNMKALMLGDSYPSTVIKSLKGFDVDEKNKLKVDYVKVSHHGSRKNISNEMLDMIECNQFVFSTNGGLGQACHPDRETIGNILYHKERDWDKEIRLYFNYPQHIVESVGYKFLKSGEEELAKFKVFYNVESL